MPAFNPKDDSPSVITMYYYAKLEMSKFMYADAIAEISKPAGELPAIKMLGEMSTSETFQQYLNTPSGSLYGFAPESRGFMPLAATAIDGLYLASAFTGGGGFTGAILGGGWAARAAMQADN